MKEEEELRRHRQRPGSALLSQTRQMGRQQRHPRGRQHVGRRHRRKQHGQSRGTGRTGAIRTNHLPPSPIWEPSCRRAFALRQSLASFIAHILAGSIDANPMTSTARTCTTRTKRLRCTPSIVLLNAACAQQQQQQQRQRHWRRSEASW